MDLWGRGRDAERVVGVARNGDAGTSGGCGRKWGCREERWVWPEVGMPGRAVSVAGSGDAGTSGGCSRKWGCRVERCGISASEVGEETRKEKNNKHSEQLIGIFIK